MNFVLIEYESFENLKIFFLGHSQFEVLKSCNCIFTVYVYLYFLNSFKTLDLYVFTTFEAHILRLKHSEVSFQMTAYTYMYM